jgi:protein subunit release factor A
VALSMRRFVNIILTSVFFFLVLFSTAPAADFNIKLRKTDINDLKQQLMPVFEQNIDYLKQLLICLEQDESINFCLNDYVQVVEKNNASTAVANNARTDEIKKSIESKIRNENIQPEQLIAELKKLLLVAEDVRLCLDEGQTANELKDCIIK